MCSDNLSDFSLTHNFHSSSSFENIPYLHMIVLSEFLTSSLSSYLPPKARGCVQIIYQIDSSNIVTKNSPSLPYLDLGTFALSLRPTKSCT